MLRIISEKFVVGLNLLIIAALVYFAARSANDIVAMWRASPLASTIPVTTTAPPTPQDITRAAYDSIVERDVFNSVKEADSNQAEPVVATDLHLKLIGTSHLTMAEPFAIIEDQRNSRQNLYKLGNEIPEAGKLVAVEKTRVLIDHAGQIVAIEIPKEMAALKADKHRPKKIPAGFVLKPRASKPPRVRKSPEQKKAERAARREEEADPVRREARRAAHRSARAARRAARGTPPTAPPQQPQQAPMPQAPPLDEASGPN